MVGPPSGVRQDQWLVVKAQSRVALRGQALEAFVNKESRQDISQSGKAEALGRIAHLTWKTLGSMLLLILSILIVIGSQRQVIILNVVFWSVVAGLMITRYVDIEVLNGQSAGDKQEKLKDWLGYLIRLTIVSGLFWFLSHGMRNWLH